jgi:hypothetical protein
MLLDTFFDPYKLIGTALVPLNSLMNEIHDEITEQNSYTPSSKSVQVPCIKITHGIFDIKNLMGEEIGHISLACRLTSFGTSLIPHIVQQKKSKEPKETTVGKTTKVIEATDTPEENERVVIKKEESEVYAYKLQKTEKHQASTNTIKFSENAVVQTISIDYQDAQVQISKASDSTDKATQSPEVKRKFPTKEILKKVEPPNEVIQVRHVQDEFVFNHFCPPVLQYHSRSATDAKSTTSIMKQSSVEKTIDDSNANNQNGMNNNRKVATVVNEKIVINQRIEYLNNAFRKGEDLPDLDQRFNENDEEPNDKDNDDEVYIVQGKPVSRQLNNMNSKNQQVDLSQLPLLNCLFEEISKLKGIVEGNRGLDGLNQSKKSLPKSSNSVSRNKTLDKKAISNASLDGIDIKFYENKKQPAKVITLDDSENQKKPVKPRKQQKKSLVGILKKTGNRKEYDKRAIDDIVARLTRPKSPRTPRLASSAPSNTSYDEIPVRGPRSDTENKPKKEPLKYGTTHTFRMRVEANKQPKVA